MITTSVNIALFKAKMGSFLKIIRRGGSLILLDRQLPIAKLLPVETSSPLPLIPPEVSFSAVKVLLKQIPRLAKKTDSFSVLQEMRKKDRVR